MSLPQQNQADCGPSFSVSMSSKEVANAFRWYRAFTKHRGLGRELTHAARYTNFSLQHAWGKFDCQTQLLTREAFVPLMKRNPEVFDCDIANFHPVYFSLMKPSGDIYPEAVAATKAASQLAEKEALKEEQTK